MEQQQSHKKLDPKRSYGTVTGHEAAKYEQDGVLFGPNGVALAETVKPLEKKQQPAPASADDFEFDRAEATTFLTTRLADGPIASRDLKNEAEALELKWEVVKAMFTELAGKEIKRGKGFSVLWSLPKP